MTRKTIVIGVVLMLVLAGITVQQIRAQAHVQNNAFDLMLSTLLQHTVAEVTVEQASKTTNAVFLDARESGEFAISHISGATWVGYDDFKIDRLGATPKDAPIIVYCSVGYRSEKISEQLKKAGYTNVSNMYGGIFEWVNRSQPVVDNQGAATNKVHAYSKQWGVWLERGEKVYE